MRSSRTRPRSCARCSAATSKTRPSIAELARWLSARGDPDRTGKDRWDRSVIWAMLQATRPMSGGPRT